MTTPLPFFHRNALRDTGMSLLAAAIISVMISTTLPPAWRINVILYGTLIGFVINFYCQLFHIGYRRWSAGRGQETSRIVLGALYFVGGVLGWLTATAIAVWIGLTPARLFRSLAPYFVPIAGLLAIVMGLLFYTWGRMEDRLRKSIERIKEHEFAEKELELAREIQQRLLPPQEVEGEGYRVAARNVAARFVAGDFYDVFRLSGGAVGVVVGDVSGKGIGASLVMASVKAVLPLVAADRSVEQTLAELNRKLVADLGPREFVALAYVRYEPDGAFTLGNAGLPDPYLLAAGKPLRALSVPGERMPLGARRESRYSALSGRLEPGERILLVTDGLPEALTEAGEPIGYAALEAFLAASDSVPPSDFLDGLFRRVREATVPTIQDDLTALVLERRPSN